ncbi:MAG: ATP-binding protein, partial [Candidatus Aenigmarchaeota archaeon]|nr:ATP-binding protein [Candidatus Aenigmarchaeota archaeon]
DEGEFYRKETINVVKRKLMRLLSITVAEDEISYSGIFDNNSGQTLTEDIIRALDTSKTVIIDTSSLSSAVEILVISIITSEVFAKYKHYRKTGELRTKPVVNVVLEEAPRVLGKEVLQRGPNIFSSIAREGRKFNIGLTAITQLPSLIPKEILANLNTKIIMGIEMQAEREAIIASAAQDLSADDRNIASLDKGEAIVSSTFTKFALPIKVPFFDNYAKAHIQTTPKEKKDFSGIKF